MKHRYWVVGAVSFLVACFLCGSVLAPTSHAENAPPSKNDNNAAPPLVRQMVGTWSVQQRMWPGPGAKAIDLPPAVAHRILIGGTILQETMKLPAGSKQTAFARMAYFDYNPTNRQYEYFSLDTRAPQMMNERSQEADSQSKPEDQSSVTLYGGTFVAPQWGEAKNVSFRYRIVIGEIAKKRQLVRLYFTPLAGENTAEFRAFEYVYTLRH
jgi:hypothetical protein